MSPETNAVDPRLGELRRAFDRSFAAPPPCGAAETKSLIVIRVAGETLVLRADDIAGIARRKRLVPLPSRTPELLGLAGIRGALVPVFNLAALLALAPCGGEPGWFALAMREAPIALAFDEFEGQVDVERTCLYDDQTAPARPHVRQLVRIGSLVRPVIEVPSILEAIRKNAGLPGQPRSSQ
jgi:chemotaxis signal transduction protein